MHILFATNRHYLPQAIGGAEWSTHILAEELVRQGHQVSIICSIHPRGFFGTKNRIARRILKDDFPRDDGQGYPVYRGWDPIRKFESVASKVRPDRVIVVGAPPRAYELALAAVELGYSTFYQVRDVDFSRHGGDLGSIPQLKFIANSEFTRKQIEESFGKNSAIVLPPIAQERCWVPRTGNRVLMINPDPSKGGDIALELAAQCPDIPFLIQESWASNRHLVEMKNAAKKLSNVQWEPPKIDIRKAFSRAKIILAPSKWEEAWGRVVSEGQVSGIPAVASRIGGLPESVGAGGILVDVPSDISNWKVALRSLWDFPETYQKYSKAATDHANRPEAQPSYQAKLLCATLKDG